MLEQIESELSLGAKRTHWIWFVFPQIAGLGRSPTVERFAIRDLAQARRYLEDDVLGARLRKHVRLLMLNRAKTAREMLGAPDDLKFRSCLTLFARASLAPEDVKLFTDGLLQFYDGEPDARTLELIKTDGGDLVIDRAGHLRG